MLELFLVESAQLIEQLEQSVLQHEAAGCYRPEAIHEIFRVMHTIKGSAAMMLFDQISALAHAMEDIFYWLREVSNPVIDQVSLCDLLLAGIDFIKGELIKLQHGNNASGDASKLIEQNRAFLETLKANNPQVAAKTSAAVPSRPIPPSQYYIPQEKSQKSQYQYCYQAVLHFSDDCELEDVRAFTVIHTLQGLTKEVYHLPEVFLDDPEGIKAIREHGLRLFFQADQDAAELKQILTNAAVLLKGMQLERLANDASFPKPSGLSCPPKAPVKVPCPPERQECDSQATLQSDIVNVTIGKLDKLMDLVGELVVAESMVAQSPDLKGLKLNVFRKSARQLHKISEELQDAVMALRMMALDTTFQKMNRVIRDMSRKLGKQVQLAISGAATEVDKKVIDHISDPLMHLVRNALDHGIEPPAQRLAAGKPEAGTITLEAKTVGGDVYIIVRDDGKGLDAAQILAKAQAKGLVSPEAVLSERDIFNLIFLPGFSTKEAVSEFSGRGVGMDVVTRNINAIGGVVLVESVTGKGTTITLKIPLTLAIIGGMNVRVGTARYTIPTMTIRQSFRPKADDVLIDPDGNELIMVRGQCYPVLRLHQHYRIAGAQTAIAKGIVIIVENEAGTVCLFADELLGEQPVVVKALPNYIKLQKQIGGLAGCTILGDGSISLILDIAGLIQARREAVVRRTDS